MDEITPKPPIAPKVPWIDRLDNFSNKLVAYRKIVMNFLVMILVTILIVILIATSFQQKLLLLPVDISETMKRKGYTPEFFAEKIVDKIDFIKQKGSSYYDNNDIELMMTDERVEVVNTLLDNTPLEGFKGMITDFLNRNQMKTAGKIIDSQDKMQITFRIDNRRALVTERGSIDSVIATAAEYIMEELQPYYLCAYYFQLKQYDKCLRLVQKLLNGEESTYKYLALHIRGNVYIEKGTNYLNDTTDIANHQLGIDYLTFAKGILDSSIANNTLRSPWLTYNSMGALYQNKKVYDTAKYWYRNSMKSHDAGANAYYNYGNIVLNEYENDSVKFSSYADSAVFYFKEAIRRNKSNVKYYIGLLKAYTTSLNVEEAKSVFFKCQDMAPDNSDIYSYMSIMYTDIGNDEMARKFTDLMEQQVKN